jgi:hypothetical protein
MSCNISCCKFVGALTFSKHNFDASLGGVVQNFVLTNRL